MSDEYKAVIVEEGKLTLGKIEINNEPAKKLSKKFLKEALERLKKLDKLNTVQRQNKENRRFTEEDFGDHLK